MIHSDSRTKEWIEEVSARYGYNDLNLIEKAIRSLSLLEALVRSGCPLIFKGGSALMLSLGYVRRLSVDVDIICPPGTDISKYLGTYCEEYGFTSFVIESREALTDIDKTHVKYHYNISYTGTARPEMILLDVVFEKNNYYRLEQIPIAGNLLKTIENPIMVSVPSISDLLGDKLTAFAPHTCGIPFDKVSKNGVRDCSMEICKQMFDIASISNEVWDIDIASTTFRKMAAVELSYRHLDANNTDAVLKDAFQTALCLCTKGQCGSKTEAERLNEGVFRMRSFIHSEKYNNLFAEIDAAKVAYLTARIYYGEQKIAKPYDKSFSANLTLISNNAINKVNKLRKSNIEAFYYWTVIAEILENNGNRILE